LTHKLPLYLIKFIASSTINKTIGQINLFDVNTLFYNLFRFKKIIRSENPMKNINKTTRETYPFHEWVIKNENQIYNKKMG